MRLSRRTTILAIGSTVLEGSGPGFAQNEPAGLSVAVLFPELEARSGGRLGIAARDTRTGNTAGHRADERFPMCSTFKLLAAAAVLARVDSGQDTLERRVAYSPADLVEYSPVTQPRVGEGSMPLGNLCEAAMTLSDNTAATSSSTRSAARPD